MFEHLTTHQKILMEREVRKYFREFILVPKNTPNEIINLFIGTIDGMSQVFTHITVTKIKARN